MVLLVAAALASALPPDAVIGTWRSPTRNALIGIARCGASICGRLLSSDGLRDAPGLKDTKNKDPRLQGRPLKGVQMLGGFRRENGAWVDGEVYNPADGRTYGGRITLVDGDHLKLRGCVFVPLCRTETWTRAR